MTEQSTAALDQAAAEAQGQEEVAEEVPQEEETVVQEEQVAEVSAEEPEEELPEDHKERSNLGRKISAYHRRVDGLENKLDRIASLLEQKVEAETTPRSEGVDMDEPLTRRELEQWESEKKSSEQKAKEKYDDDYRNTVIQLGTDLAQSEWDELVAELQQMPQNSTGNAKFDAERNFLMAENSLLRKKSTGTAEKVNPLVKKRPAVSPGITNQKVVEKEATLPKLTGAAQSYLDMVAREDGEENAQKLRKSLA